MIEILLVEDDPVLGRGLSVNLEHEGYRVHWARSLAEAGELNEKKKLDLVLLDLGLPDGSGLTFLRATRKAGSRIPIVILTAKTDVDSVVEGLQSGASDYIRKPFDDRELLARIKTVLREPQTREAQVRFEDLLLLVEKRQVFFKETELELTPREFDILSFFIQHAEMVITREALLSAIDKEAELFDRAVDSNISHVRAKLKKAGVASVQISSVYGVGYRLERG